MDENKTAESQPTEEMAVAPVAEAPVPQMGIWSSAAAMKTAYGMAKVLASTDLAPEGTYKNNPANCLIALDMAQRTGMPPLAVMQNLFVIKGKPAWSGQACTAIVNGSGRFTPLEFVRLVEDDGKTTAGYYAKATRVATGEVCEGPPVTWDMVKKEGWYSKSGSKWQTMPDVMFGYRAAAFFARRYCPDLLCGIQTVEEVRDVNGYDEQPKETTVITFD